MRTGKIIEKAIEIASMPDVDNPSPRSIQFAQELVGLGGDEFFDRFKRHPVLLLAMVADWGARNRWDIIFSIPDRSTRGNRRPAKKAVPK